MTILTTTIIIIMTITTGNNIFGNCVIQENASCHKGFYSTGYMHYHKTVYIYCTLLTYSIYKQSCGSACSQDRDRWQTLVSMVMNLRVPWNAGNFLTSCKPVSFSRRTLRIAVSEYVSKYVKMTNIIKKKKLRGLSPHANYTDRAAAAGRRS